MQAMWTLAIFILNVDQAHLEFIADEASCLAAYKTATASAISPASVEKAMCTSPNGKVVHWIVKDGKAVG